jgi:adenosine/AMP kinase
MNLQIVPVESPEGTNVILGQAHFIKTVEDLAEVMALSPPGAKWGLAFNEASGPCLVRADGNDPELRQAAIAIAQSIGAGHLFVLVLHDIFPVSVLDRVRACPEVCTVYCASGNPLEVIVAESVLGRGVLGVIDGERPRGVETERDATDRRAFLRKTGYKR